MKKYSLFDDIKDIKLDKKEMKCLGRYTEDCLKKFITDKNNRICSRCKLHSDYNTDGSVNYGKAYFK